MFESERTLIAGVTLASVFGRMVGPGLCVWVCEYQSVLSKQTQIHGHLCPLTIHITLPYPLPSPTRLYLLAHSALFRQPLITSLCCEYLLPHWMTCIIIVANTLNGHVFIASLSSFCLAIIFWFFFSFCVLLLCCCSWMCHRRWCCSSSLSPVCLFNIFGRV